MAHLRRRRCRTREPRRTSERDGASGRAVPNGRGQNPWPASPVWDAALTPAPRQPLPGQSGFASGCRLSLPPAARGPGAGTPHAISSRSGSSRVGFIPSPPLSPGPRLVLGRTRCAEKPVPCLSEPRGGAGASWLTAVNYRPVNVPDACLGPRPTPLLSPLPLPPVFFDFRIFSFLKDKFAICSDENDTMVFILF